ncbi:type I glyceraldehyde-3-phosphate dehydrogenase [Candidatus Peregrinibacteria bacterium CG_4_10_14_0_2_um_filter_38_24]|nr:MAG: type I glyceraldehyde-3-phosphate dehydrogenase [Candidatus Peregrinibacteria bacterium CG_4_10_14_0_2_um_filter_38_24]PJC38647.1 MAG: type I glyceraldehyde-3-phosphate dehydrogenase [Candidatus Peregrinibacteria bacterium CG_4_9_14_0_2_um_filter_38_9]
MPIKIAINGYGRIGRDLHRQIIGRDDMEVTAINSRSDASSHAYLLKHDSLYGICDADIKVDGNDMVVNGKKTYVYQIKDPAETPWAKHDIDIVIESTGNFTTMADAEKHLQAGAKKVLVTAPCKEKEIPNIVIGVNEKNYNPADFKVVSNASCTTNCLAPVLEVLNKEFGVNYSLVTTIHAFTFTQNLLDNSNPEDFRRSRATTESIIPTTTGAMKAISRVIPSLEGKVDGMAFRVPVPTVSCIDLVADLGKTVTVEEVNEMFKKYENGEMKGILGTTDEELVSVDFRGDSRSSIVDLLSTKVLMGNKIKVISWYDNEWGYVSRIKDLISWFK